MSGAWSGLQLGLALGLAGITFVVDLGLSLSLVAVAALSPVALRRMASVRSAASSNSRIGPLPWVARAARAAVTASSVWPVASRWAAQASRSGVVICMAYSSRLASGVSPR